MKNLAVACVSLCLILALVSCQDIFTSSLASALAQPPSVPSKITADQVDDLIAMAAGDPALAEAVLKSLNTLIDATPPGDEQNALIADASDLAVESSGISVAVFDILDIIVEAGGSPTPAQITDITAALAHVNLSDAALVALRALEAHPDAADASTLAFSGMALILSATDGIDITTLTGPQLTALQADPDFVSGRALLDLANAKPDADLSILDGLDQFLNTP